METKNNEINTKKKCYLVSSTKNGLKTIEQVKSRDQRIRYLRNKRDDKIKMLEDRIRELESKICNLENNRKTLSSFGNYRFMEKIGADAVSTRLKNKDDDFGEYYVVYRINGKWYRQWHPIKDAGVDHNDDRLEDVE